ncbi:polysaccharide deacetylase family protein [Metabacillus sp. RGM 3146]|uniref:polysaccharide deacetylase family protein n=1 Tax=Metabacillus sp. RGM 3146 TaxID=3401092 RepID=UPI003B9C2B57
MKQVSAGDSRQIYLTFDDGPSPTTGKLLDILKKHRTKATFFMLEPNRKKHKDMVKRLYAEGNGMGLHGVTHNPKAFYRSPSSVVGEMKTGQST